MENKVTFQSFRSVFRSGLEDLALLNAVMLAFAFGENGGIMDAECLEYKGKAIKSIAEKIKSPGIAITETIIGAILLLVGVEVSITVYLCRELCHIRLLPPCRRSDSEGVRRYRSICQLYGSCSRYPNPVKHILMTLSNGPFSGKTRRPLPIQ